MVKIKVEKKMNLVELLQWAFDNANLVKGKFIPPNKGEGEWGIYFTEKGSVVFRDKIHTLDDTFTVEVQEEITEKTVIPQLLEIQRDSEGDIFFLTTWNDTIACAKDSNSLSFYKVNGDATLTLLWTKEGGMQ